jgi:hypothetical protein
MKKVSLSIAVLLFVFMSVNSYSLDNFNYKGLGLDNTGQILPTTAINVRITISTGAGVQFQETHNGVTTDQFAGFTVEVGSGLPVTGTLGGIATATADMSIKCETNVGGGSWVLSTSGYLSEAMDNALGEITKYAWGLKGNASTAAGTNFLGTTDGVATEIRVENSGTINNSIVLNANGSIQHDNPSSSVSYVVGNARGKNAVDLQSYRVDATEVASGENSTIGGGAFNIASGFGSAVGGGAGNIVSKSYSTVGGGADNTASGAESTIGGGLQNTANRQYSTVGGGVQNTANSIESTIGGGNDNTANGGTSTIGGGWHNVAGGGWSTIGGGMQNTASASNSTVGGGGGNSASNISSTVGGGNSNIASGENSTISGGYLNRANSEQSTISGGYYAVTDKYGQNAYASGRFTSNGDAQTSLFVVRNETTDDSWTELYLDGTDATERMLLNDQDIWTFRALVVGGSDDHTHYASYEITGFIERHGGYINIRGVTTTVIYETSSSYDAIGALLGGTWGLGIIVKGDAAVTMRWVARVEVAQLNY